MAKAQTTTAGATLPKIGEKFKLRPEAVIIDESKNISRAFPYNDAEIFARACTLKMDGQINPIGVIFENGQYVCNGNGVGRTLGARYLNANDPDFAKTPFELEAVLMAPDADLFAVAVAENFQRKNLTPADIAHIILQSDARVGGDQRQKDDAAFSLFGMEPTTDNRKWVVRHRKIAELPEPVRLKIHNKVLSVDAALELVDLSPDLAEKVADEATDGGKKKGKKGDVKQAKAKAGAKSAEKGRMGFKETEGVLRHWAANAKKQGARNILKGFLQLINRDLAEPDFVALLLENSVGPVVAAPAPTAPAAPAKTTKTGAAPMAKGAVKTAKTAKAGAPAHVAKAAKAAKTAKK